MQSYIDTLPQVKAKVIPDSPIPHGARRREAVYEQALIEIVAHAHVAGVLGDSHAALRFIGEIASRAFIAGNTCHRCGHLGTPDDPVVDWSEQIYYRNPDGAGEMPSGYWRPDQGCKHGAWCDKRRAEREASA